MLKCRREETKKEKARERGGGREEKEDLMREDIKKGKKEYMLTISS